MLDRETLLAVGRIGWDRGHRADADQDQQPGHQRARPAAGRHHVPAMRPARTRNGGKMKKRIPPGATSPMAAPTARKMNQNAGRNCVRSSLAPTAPMITTAASIVAAATVK